MADEQRRLRVAYLVPPSPHFAGVERVAHEIASGLAVAHSDELDVHVLFSTSYDDPELENTPYTIHVLDTDRLRSLPSVLRKAVARGRFDVLIVAQVEPAVMSWISLVGLRVPVFVTHLHGNPRVELRRGSWRTRVAFGLFRNLVARRTAAVFAVAPGLTRYLKGYLHHTVPVYFVRNPARVVGGNPVPSRSADGAYRLLTVGRLDHQKGLDTLLHAMALVHARAPHVRLTIVGSGPDEGALRRLRTDLRLEGVVELVGYSSQLAPYFSAANCYVLSSRWEGFPLVLLEALRFGLPIVASDCEFGPADLVTDRRIGKLVPPGSAGALADGICSMLGVTDSEDDLRFRRTVASGFERGPASEEHYDLIMRLAEQAAARGDLDLEFSDVGSGHRKATHATVDEQAGNAQRRERAGVRPLSRGTISGRA